MGEIGWVAVRVPVRVPVPVRLPEASGARSARPNGVVGGAGFLLGCGPGEAVSGASCFA